MEVNTISVNEVIDNPDDYHIVDVRSEKEFFEDHLFSAYNIPILDDQQRHIVGYIYANVDKKDALDLGYKILDKKIESFVSKLKKVKDKKIVIMCFRGGMRSRSVTQYLNDRGVECLQLKGGYKKYRAIIKERLDNFDFSDKDVFVLYGLTGTNKTDIVKKIHIGIDLEGMCQHRSSIFGAVGLIPSTQKWFDTQLYFSLKKSGKKILFEGESKKIGDLFINENVFNAMKKGKNIKIVMSKEQRAKNICKDYFDTKEKANQVREITYQLKERLGKKKVDELIDLIDKKRYIKYVLEMFENYYDILYKHTVDNKKYSLEIVEDNLEKAVKKVEEFIKND